MSRYDQLINNPIKQTRKSKQRERREKIEATVVSLANPNGIICVKAVQVALNCSLDIARKVLRDMASDGKLNRHCKCEKVANSYKLVVTYSLK